MIYVCCHISKFPAVTALFCQGAKTNISYSTSTKSMFIFCHGNKMQEIFLQFSFSSGLFEFPTLQLVAVMQVGHNFPPSRTGGNNPAIYSLRLPLVCFCLRFTFVFVKNIKTLKMFNMFFQRHQCQQEVEMIQQM